jgi:plasmid segregation protein ParM
MSNEQYDVAVDDGHDGIKICAGFDQKGKAMCTHTKSRCMHGIHHVVAVGGGSINKTYLTEGEHYTTTDAGALANYEETRKSDYQVSPMNRVLVQHALLRAGFGGKRVRITAGLPMSDYFRGEGKNDALIQSKMDNLLIPVSPLQADVQPVVIESVDVRAEGVMAYFDLAYKADGSVDEEFQRMHRRRPLAVVDLGGKTLNIVVVTEGENKGIYQQRSGSALIGALEFRDSVADALRARFNLQGTPPADYVEEAIMTAVFEIHGREEDVSELVAAARSAFASRITSEITRRIGHGDDLAGMVFAGGGVELLGKEAWAAKVYPGRVIVPEEPVYANARGMYKASLLAQAMQD